MLQNVWTFWKATSWYPENNTYPKYCCLKSHCGFSVSEQYLTWTLNSRYWRSLWCFWPEKCLNLIIISRSFGTDFGKMSFKKIWKPIFSIADFCLKHAIQNRGKCQKGNIGYVGGNLSYHVDMIINFGLWIAYFESGNIVVPQ